MSDISQVTECKLHVLYTGESSQLRPANLMSAYSELSELSASRVSFNPGRNYMSNALTDVQPIGTRLTAVQRAPNIVNPANLMHSADSNNSVSMASSVVSSSSSQASDVASFAVPSLPVNQQSHAKAASVAADSGVIAQTVANHGAPAALAGQPESSSSRHVLPTMTLFKVTFLYLNIT